MTQTTVQLDAYNFTFKVPFEVLEAITVGTWNMTVDEFQGEYTHDDAETIYEMLQDTPNIVGVELKLDVYNSEQKYALQEYRVVLHYDRLNLTVTEYHEGQSILTKQELREYAIGQFLQYEDFGNINFWGLEVDIEVLRIKF
jgi:hypothetical protein